jgi:predicted amidohydrolase
MNKLGSMLVPTRPHIWFLDISDHWSLIALRARAVKNNICGLAVTSLLTLLELHA